MSRRDTRTPEERELDERIERAADIEARLDAPLTRRELIDALNEVASEYGAVGDHDSGLIYDAFRNFARHLS